TSARPPTMPGHATRGTGIPSLMNDPLSCPFLLLTPRRLRRVATDPPASPPTRILLTRAVAEESSPARVQDRQISHAANTGVPIATATRNGPRRPSQVSGAIR